VGIYPSVIQIFHHLWSQRPRCTTGWTLCTTCDPSIEVFVAVPGGTVPVAAGVVCHFDIEDLFGGGFSNDKIGR